MDRIDWSILKALESDGRIAYGKLGAQVGLSKTPCWTRVQRLEEQGVITGYRADIARVKVGLPMVAFCEIIVDFKHHAAFEGAIQAHPAVQECYTTAGQGDYLLKLLCRDVDHLDSILREQISGIIGVVRTSTMIALKSIKQPQGVIQFAEMVQQTR